MTVLSHAASSARAADRARDRALLVLLRCWLRETGHRVPGPGPLTVDLPATGAALRLEVVRRSPTGGHDLTGCRDPEGRPLDVEAVAGLLTREAAARAGHGPERAADALTRIVESARRAAGYAAARTADPDDAARDRLPGWLVAEQGLVAGHPWHPMTKSRDGLPEAEDRRFAPEARGRFRLHWYAASPAVARHGGAGLDVPALLHPAAGGPPVPDGYLPVPAHPWQAAHPHPGAAELLARGDLVDLGPAGAPWWATSSLRTVARPGSPVMLKLSLGLRVTNSRRENTRAELHQAARTARLVDAGLGAALAAAHPGFGLVRDPGWVGVDGPAGPVGLDALVRERPFPDDAPVRCAGALVDARPDLGEPVAATLVRARAAHRRVPVAAAAADWYRHWLHAVAVPLLWLHGSLGVGLEAHLQNVLVRLGPDGLPVGGWYRDNQGWYLASSRLPRVAGLLRRGAARTDTDDTDDTAFDPVDGLVFADDLVTDRVVYYLGVNHLLGVAGALAEAGLAAEEELLAVLAEVLAAHLRGPEPSPAAARLLEAPTLPVKANLLTGVDGRDELDGPVEAQSVYVDVPNPLLEVQR